MVDMTQGPDAPEPSPIALRPGDLVRMRDPERLEGCELDPEISAVVVDVDSQSMGVVSVLLPQGIVYMNTWCLRGMPSPTGSR